MKQKTYVGISIRVLASETGDVLSFILTKDSGIPMTSEECVDALRDYLTIIESEVDNAN